MVAVKRNLYIEQGATFSLGFNWYEGVLDGNGDIVQGPAHDLTGASARMQIRQRLSGPVLVSVTSDAGGGIVLGTVDGRIDITIRDTLTDLITTVKAVYDLEVVLASGVVDRVLQGDVTCNLNVTRDAP